jgi:putative flippase GtrA
VQLKLWHKQFLRFCVVGVAATSVHVMAAFLLLMGFGLTLTAANIGAFFTSLSVSYFGNALWSFETKGEIKSLLKFSVLCFISLTSTILISQWVTATKWPAYYGILICATVVPIISFSVQKLWIFQK